MAADEQLDSTFGLDPFPRTLSFALLDLCCRLSDRLWYIPGRLCTSTLTNSQSKGLKRTRSRLAQLGASGQAQNDEDELLLACSRLVVSPRDAVFSFEGWNGLQEVRVAPVSPRAGVEAKARFEEVAAGW